MDLGRLRLMLDPKPGQAKPRIYSVTMSGGEQVQGEQVGEFAVGPSSGKTCAFGLYESACLRREPAEPRDR